jgi:hypothetical protein
MAAAGKAVEAIAPPETRKPKEPDWEKNQKPPPTGGNESSGETNHIKGSWSR